MESFPPHSKPWMAGPGFVPTYLSQLQPTQFSFCFLSSGRTTNLSVSRICFCPNALYSLEKKMTLCFTQPGALPSSFISSSHLLAWPLSTMLLKVWSPARSSRITWRLVINAHSGALPHNLCLNLGLRTLFHEPSREFLCTLMFENHCTVAMILKLLCTLDSSRNLLKLLVLRATLQNNSESQGGGTQESVFINLLVDSKVQPSWRTTSRLHYLCLSRAPMVPCTSLL